MDIMAVVVTYANRWNLTRQTIDSCLSEGVKSVVLVDNASEQESQKFYDELISNNDRITLVRNKENLGSAGGFRAGLDRILGEEEVQEVWLLDDDNVPQPGALAALLSAKEMLRVVNKGQDVVVYSYRGGSWVDDRNAVYKGFVKKYSNNSFIDFDVMRKFVNKTFGKRESNSINFPLIRTYIGPYGGMLINVRSLKRIGLPNQEFYLYADDHEFTMRLNKIGVPQFLVYSSQLVDIDFTFTSENHLFSSNTPGLKVFYSVRNHVYLNQEFITSRIRYGLNKWTLLSVLIIRSWRYFLASPVNYKKRLFLILTAIKDGEKGLLGQTFEGRF